MERFFSVAATQSPVIFIGTGEQIDEFEQFKAKSFVSKLLGEEDFRKIFGKKN
jgi:signal recognition particle subunit SRP54